MSEFSQNLSNLMIDRGMDDGKVAEAVGTEEDVVREWRRGGASPNLDQLIAVSDALDVTVDELLGKISEGEITAARTDSTFDDDDNDDDHECYVTEDEHGRHSWKWRKKPAIAAAFRMFPFSMVCVMVYLALGFAAGLWHPTWIIFLLVPVYKAITEDPAQEFPWAILMTIVYLLIGFTSGAWHPWWCLYLTTPIYHCVVGIIERNNRK